MYWVFQKKSGKQYSMTQWKYSKQDKKGAEIIMSIYAGPLTTSTKTI